ncbi:MAG: D-aminoacyl-tRNA deacylase [Bdellovibrionota bacterium]
MRAIIQRVLAAEVTVHAKQISKIGSGLLTFLGVQKGDTEEKADKLIKKIVELRIFSDEMGKMNLSLLDKKAEHLIVSQFTLAADCSSGRRPSFITAEEPQKAKYLYERSIEISRGFGIPTFGGEFQADMKVSLQNDGPVTFILEL